MLTVDFKQFPVDSGNCLLDLGCGAGRHTFEALRRGADVVAFDQDAEELETVKTWIGAMHEAGEAPPGGSAVTQRGDALALPFPDNSFDRLIASEILEHIPDDERAIAEIARVVKPGGLAAITVPRSWPERICWALSNEYRATPGGHVRIYKANELADKLRATGLQLYGRHHVHSLHAPYWWLKCAVGLDNDKHFLPRTYHRLLAWDITKRPWITQTAEQILNPVAGKSLVLYLRKPEEQDAAS